MQATTTTPVLTWSTGGYPHDYRSRTAGPFGCHPCWHCDQRPAEGATVWTNSYGDLYCDPCARKLAAIHDARTTVYDREFDGLPRPWVPDPSDLEQNEEGA